MRINKINSAVLCSEKTGNIKNFSNNNVEKPNVNSTKTPPLVPITFMGKVNRYISELAIGLTKEFGEKVKPSQLKPVMTKEEFVKVIPKLTEQNYVAGVENVRNGTFIADLHSHTHYSDGRITVENMLEQAVEYGNRLKNINGKPFIFALSDHDGVKGDIEALKIISENPKKYENIKFIPAAELSFVVPCEAGSRRAERYKTDVQMPEVLAFNLNPFSEISKTFFKDLYEKRKNMTSEMIKGANQLIRDSNFSVKEYNQYALKRRADDYFIMNQYWHVLDYILAKTAIVEAAKKQMKGVSQLTREVLEDLQRKNTKPISFNIMAYVRDHGWLSNVAFPEFAYDKLQEKFFPHAQGNVVRTNVEHTFDDVVDYAQKENANLALAHPVYFLQNFKLEDGYQRLCEYIKKAKGCLNFAEKYHQAYFIAKNRDIRTVEELKEYNKILDKTDLTFIGGRDNHSFDFAKFQEPINTGGTWI